MYSYTSRCVWLTSPPQNRVRCPIDGGDNMPFREEKEDLSVAVGDSDMDGRFLP